VSSRLLALLWVRSFALLVVVSVSEQLLNLSEVELESSSWEVLKSFLGEASIRLGFQLS
jgi:hypothetical protein